MATLTVKFKENKAAPVDKSAAEKVFKGMRTVFEHDKAQDVAIRVHLLNLVKKKDGKRALALTKAGYDLVGLPTDGAKQSGEYEMKIQLDGEEVGKNTVWINKSNDGVNIGISGVNSSEKAAAVLLSKKDKVEGLALKKGDGEHASDLKWSLGGESGSLPLTAHTKGDGGKNEKAALIFLKKTLKAAGYI